MRALNRARLGTDVGDQDDELMSVGRADPTGVVQRALGGFPGNFGGGEEVVIAWLMTLPDDVCPSHAVRSLLSVRKPFCSTTHAPPPSRLHELLGFIALLSNPDENQ